MTYYEQLAKEKNKQLFIENSTYHIPKEDIQECPKGVLVESKGKKCSFYFHTL